MKETTFKALMHCGQYVDANLLSNGIYLCSKPFIYSKDETIESLIERATWSKCMNGLDFLSESYANNLKQCQLVEVSLTEIVK